MTIAEDWDVWEDGHAHIIRRIVIAVIADSVIWWPSDVDSEVYCCCLLWCYPMPIITMRKSWTPLRLIQWKLCYCIWAAACEVVSIGRLSRPETAYYYGSVNGTMVSDHCFRSALYGARLTVATGAWLLERNQGCIYTWASSWLSLPYNLCFRYSIPSGAFTGE